MIGGGYGGATAAKYVRMWSDYGIDVTLVEPNPAFVSCPISNLVIGGSKTLADITTPYAILRDVKVLLQTRNSTPRPASSPMAPAKGWSIWLVAPSSRKSMPRPCVTTTILVLGSAAR